jgi:HSP20 family molecular chaperone IbpA
MAEDTNDFGIPVNISEFDNDLHISILAPGLLDWKNEIKVSIENNRLIISTNPNIKDNIAKKLVEAAKNRALIETGHIRSHDDDMTAVACWVT